MFSYTAFGLGIRSALPLPELLASNGAPDVVVRLGRVGHMPPVVADGGCSFWASPEEARLFYENVGAFRVMGGREIVVDPAPEVDERILRLIVLGPAMATLLHQREFLVLHANSVAVNGGAVAFLGKPGQGKSTLSAALYARSHGLVADDVTAIHIGTGHSVVYPGFPQIKLCPDAAVSMGDDPETLPLISPRLNKRARRATRRFPQEPLPLKRIYLLEDGPHMEIEPLRPQEAIMALVIHSYPLVAFLLKPTGTAPAHLRQCTELAGCVPICRLTSQRSLSALPNLARFVEEDLAKPDC